MGGTVSRNFMLFGEILGTLLNGPSVKSPYGYMSTWDGIYGLVSVGPGASYYLDQVNLYTTGALTITRLFGKKTDGQFGYGANLGLGRAWWATTNWRTGIVGVLQFAIAEDEFRGITTSVVPSVRFTSTWN